MKFRYNIIIYSFLMLSIDGFSQNNISRIKSHHLINLVGKNEDCFKKLKNVQLVVGSLLPCINCFWYNDSITAYSVYVDTLLGKLYIDYVKSFDNTLYGRNPNWIISDAIVYENLSLDQVRFNRNFIFCTDEFKNALYAVIDRYKNNKMVLYQAIVFDSKTRKNYGS